MRNKSRDSPIRASGKAQSAGPAIRSARGAEEGGARGGAPVGWEFGVTRALRHVARGDGWGSVRDPARAWRCLPHCECRGRTSDDNAVVTQESRSKLHIFKIRLCRAAAGGAGPANMFMDTSSEDSGYHSQYGDGTVLLNLHC